MLPSVSSWPAARRKALAVLCLLSCAAPAVSEALRATRGPSSIGPAEAAAITVTDPGTGASTGLLLARALAAAHADPGDNVIRFDPRVFLKEGSTVRLVEPIVVVASGGGQDCIDGTLPEGELMLEAGPSCERLIVVEGAGTIALRNLSLSGPAAHVVMASGTGCIRLEHVTIRGGDGPGVVLFDSARAVLTGCLLTAHRTHGIELHGQSSADLTDTAAEGNGQSGLAAYDESRATGRLCRLSGNGDWNLVLAGRSRVDWTGGLLARSRFAQADASGSARLSLTDCTLADGSRFGLFASGQAVVTASRSQWRRHAGRGIELQDEAALSVDRSAIESSGDYGVLLFGRSRLTASDSTFAGNGAHGASFRGSACGRLRGCAFVGNRYSGVGALDAGEGGPVEIAACTFSGNGMRPIYRGPMHLDPLVPTPVRIEGPVVHCLADPAARIELYLDGAGESARYLKTVRADGQGRFDVDGRDVPDGCVMTAAATVGGSTSEFNVVAGPVAEPILSALLAQTGPLSDAGGEARQENRLRRWPPGTKLVFQFDRPPGTAIQRYVRFLTGRIESWTQGQIQAEARFGSAGHVPPEAAVVSVRYVEAESSSLRGRGGVTFLKWEPGGWFVRPMEILLATATDPSQTCPRVLAHEIGHTLGLCHVSAGLLSRMQGSVPPRQAGLVNDFSPMLTFYDVLALRILYDPRIPAGASLADLAAAGLIPPPAGRALAQSGDGSDRPAFSPAAPPPPGRPDGGAGP